MTRDVTTMKERYDVVIIGGSIAGVSAALTCVNRGKTVAVIANGAETSNLYKAEKITNYPGIPDASGKEISEILRRQLESCGADLIHGRALNVIPLGDRGKTVAVIGNGEEAAHDADFLESIGCTVLRMTKQLRYEIRGGMKADKLVAGDAEYKVDGIFIIKDTISVTKLVPGLEYANGAIVTDRQMNTSIPGVFAAGDCTGKPYQLAKAAGEGNIAALSACAYIDNKKKEN